jgi:hypothetical protein
MKLPYTSLAIYFIKIKLKILQILNKNDALYFKFNIYIYLFIIIVNYRK